MGAGSDIKINTFNLDTKIQKGISTNIQILVHIPSLWAKSVYVFNRPRFINTCLKSGSVILF